MLRLSKSKGRQAGRGTRWCVFKGEENRGASTYALGCTDNPNGSYPFGTRTPLGVRGSGPNLPGGCGRWEAAFLSFFFQLLPKKEKIVTLAPLLPLACVALDLFLPVSHPVFKAVGLAETLRDACTQKILPHHLPLARETPFGLVTFHPSQICCAPSPFHKGIVKVRPCSAAHDWTGGSHPSIDRREVVLWAEF